jgi:hypothetical protein
VIPSYQWSASFRETRTVKLTELCDLITQVRSPKEITEALLAGPGPRRGSCIRLACILTPRNFFLRLPASASSTRVNESLQHTLVFHTPSDADGRCILVVRLVASSPPPPPPLESLIGEAERFLCSPDGPAPAVDEPVPSDWPGAWTDIG